MTADNPAVMEFLLNRRSRPAKLLHAPVPDRASLRPILTAAARTPDHGKLVPWRFIVLEKPALTRLAMLVSERAAERALPEDQITKSVAQYANADLVVAVIAVPRASDKIPALEQTLTAGAVCLALLNAALASGWGANWLSGWASHDREFVTRGLGLQPSEYVAGMIHIGTCTNPPPDRPRPDLDEITQWQAD